MDPSEFSWNQVINELRELKYILYAPGGFWRYKEHGKAAIIDIFKMSMAEFNSLEKIKDTYKTVLDKMFYIKFKSAMEGNSRDADFLLNQAF